MYRLHRLTVSAACFPLSLAASAEPKLQPLATLDVPGEVAEIIAYHPGGGLLLSTNAASRCVDLFNVALVGTPTLTPVDLDPDPDRPEVQSWSFEHEPTSVAVHPTQPIALAAVLGAAVDQPGRVVGINLRRDDAPAGGSALGRVVLDRAVGMHPDSVAISPDGRWAVVACEGEGLDEARDTPGTPGSIWVLDMHELTVGRDAAEVSLPAFELSGLESLVGEPTDRIEPEYVTFDPRSRFAVVTLQENDAFVVVDWVSSDGPRLAGITRLPTGSEPDGAAVLDGILGDDGRPAVLIAVAEEGVKQSDGGYSGNCLSLYRLDPAVLGTPATLLARVDIRPLLDPDKPDKRRDPESVRLLRWGGRVFCVLAVERGDCLMLFDVTEASAPVYLDQAAVGARPEGLIVIPDPAGPLLVTGDEGRPGTISFTRLVP